MRLYPVPEDVTGVNTHDIVRQIRCETREAVRDVILDELKRLTEATPPNPVAVRLLNEYRKTARRWTISVHLFSEYPNIADVFKVIYAVGIAYNFDLTMTEENDIGTTIDALGGWAPKFTLGFSADADRGRKNERSFTITDTFKGLMTQLGHPSPEGIRYCDNHIVEANYVYPIAGHIGVITLVKTFLNLVVFDDLAAGKDKATPGSAGGPPSIADQLTFTTTIDASLSPKITFSPVGHTLEMSDVGFTGKVSRIDTHQVTVGLAVESSAVADLTALRNYVFGTGGPPMMADARDRVPAGGRIILANTLTAHANTNAEGLAALAIVS